MVVSVRGDTRLAVRARRVVAAALALVLLAWDAPAAALDAASETELKAAFVLNFARFTEWPPEALPPAGKPFLVAVLGPADVAEEIGRTLAGKTVHDRPIAVRHAASPAAAAAAHALVVMGDDPGVDAALAAIGGRPVLTVGEGASFLADGGMIAFEREDGKLRFEVNAAAADRCGVRLSSQLLKLARRIVRDGEPTP